MCGRFLLTTPKAQLASLFSLSSDDTLPLAPRYNIAPSQPVAIVRPTEQENGREMVSVLWGLVPQWTRKRAVQGGIINACAETVAEKPSFRDSFRQRRCLIPADGFYEWQVAGKHKKGYAIQKPDRSPLAFAGIWDGWMREDGSLFQTAAILTTQANDVLRPLHQRMPVIVPQERLADWLDPTERREDVLQHLLNSLHAPILELTPVCSWVNNARNEGPRCLEAALPATPSLF